MPQPTNVELPRTMLQVLTLGILIATSFWILTPFLAALAWAATIVVATWPLLLQVEKAFGGRRGPAVAVMILALLLLLIVPLSYGVDAIVGNTERIVAWSHSLATITIPEPPSWLASLPLVGHQAADRWREAAAMSPDQLAAELVPYAHTVGVWVVQQVGGIGMLVGQFLLTVLVAAILYSNGEKAAFAVRAFARRLADDQGVEAVQLATMAIRGVALGVVVTAILQTAMSAVGLLVADVPFASVLIALIFVLCVAQLGPFLVMLPATIWVYSTDGTVWGAVFLAWSLICGVMDSFVRPVLIRRGADLPLLLILAGVLGGLFAMGVIGLFLGPVVLAVAYTVLREWVSEGSDDVASPNPGG